jgi:hypothetical protein
VERLGKNRSADRVLARKPGGGGGGGGKLRDLGVDGMIILH